MYLNSTFLINFISFMIVRVTALENAKPVPKDVVAQLVLIDTHRNEPLSTGVLIVPGYCLISTRTWNGAPEDINLFRVICGCHNYLINIGGLWIAPRHGDPTAERIKSVRMLSLIGGMNESVVLIETKNARSGRSVAEENGLDPIGPMRKLLIGTYNEWPMGAKFWIIGWLKEGKELTKSYIVVTLCPLEECQAQDVEQKILLCTKASSAQDLSAKDVGAGVAQTMSPHRLIGLVLYTHNEYAVVEDTSFIVSYLEELLKNDVIRRARMKKKASGGDMAGITQKVQIAGIALSLRHRLALKI